MKKKRNPEPRIVCVCGGRDYEDSIRVHRVLFKEHKKRPFDFLLHGDSRGADRLAQAWSKIGEGVQEIAMPAMWSKWQQPGGRANPAGPLRNMAMLEILKRFKKAKLIAFPGGTGTEHMVKICKAAGIKVKRIKA